MLLAPFAKLPPKMQNEHVKIAYSSLTARKNQLILKRGFDILLSLFLLIIFSAPMAIIALLIMAEGSGSVIFSQKRITQFNQSFNIYKFRTMEQNSIKGDCITKEGDERITQIGAFLRENRLDELPQLFNILKGEMSFVGPRPELEVFTQLYNPQMQCSLLLPAGLTSQASLLFKDEALLLNCKENLRVYKELILPLKADINANYVKEFSFLGDIKLIMKTARAFCSN